MKTLVGNTWPMTLVRRDAMIEIVEEEIFEKIIMNVEICSFWGHKNTLATVNKKFGVDFTPQVERPAVTLSENKLPVLSGVEFKEAFIVNPTYVEGFRPQIGEEVGEEKIEGWVILMINFDESLYYIIK